MTNRRYSLELAYAIYSGSSFLALLLSRSPRVSDRAVASALTAWNASSLSKDKLQSTGLEPVSGVPTVSSTFHGYSGIH